MKAFTFCVLVLVAVVVGCAKSPEPTSVPIEQPPEAAKDVPPALAEIFKERNQLHKRQTGALLTINAKWVHDPGLEPGIRVYWTIDYDGPRRPFTILTLGTVGNPVVAHFWHIRPDGKPATFVWEWGKHVRGAQPRNQKGMFSVADGKMVTGNLAVGVSYLKGRLGSEPSPSNPPLWIQLEYDATNRGDGFDVIVDPATGTSAQGPDWTLDAWTGKLWSPVVEVAVK